jgi:hypothetical protein
MQEADRILPKVLPTVMSSRDFETGTANSGNRIRTSRERAAVRDHLGGYEARRGIYPAEHERFKKILESASDETQFYPIGMIETTYSPIKTLFSGVLHLDEINKNVEAWTEAGRGQSRTAQATCDTLKIQLQEARGALAECGCLASRNQEFLRSWRGQLIAVTFQDFAELAEMAQQGAADDLREAYLRVTERQAKRLHPAGREGATPLADSPSVRSSGGLESTPHRGP